MKLHEENLKKIIECIEKYGSIDNINIKNNEVKICLPDSVSAQKKYFINFKKSIPSKLKTIDLNRPKEYTITFIMGDTKEKL